MALPFETDRFDAAVMALVLFFVPDPAKGVAEMARVVRPGGTVSTYLWIAGEGPPAPFTVELAASAPRWVNRAFHRFHIQDQAGPPIRRAPPRV